MTERFKLEDKESNIGATLSCYASGDGSLSFVYQNREGRATGDNVTRRDVEYFVKVRRPELASWVILEQHGLYKLFKPVTRSAPDEVKYDGRAWRYAKIHEQDFRVFDSEGSETRNHNIIGAIMFYVNNERACDEAMRSG